ncbi:hypothetical protein GCM10025857_19570 [Alicyclobacillus contaminans]|uniref:class D sortase n=1 Tax=Alicyclobacillus contaminans TaxID=392016 RepID=UPI0004245F66|nr:class D sortase [Alicyclobacillus contaminans]GMA50600.1 hypothetical protein GCM10025857_19570 [Alicyclobacillus contaminans]
MNVALGMRRNGLPALLVAVGMTLTLGFGWDYFQQIVGLGHRPVPAYRAGSSRHRWPVRPAIGTGIGVLNIPAIHLTAPIIQGTGAAQLREGVGHAPDTALPGQGSNVFLAGHRDTVFRALGRIHTGDVVTFDTLYGKFVYQVTFSQVVTQYDTQVMKPTPQETLTLMTCYPFLFFGFAPDRYIVHAKLLSAPAGNAR